MLGCDCRVTRAWANLDAVASWPWSGLIKSFSVEMCRQVDTFPSEKKFLHFRLWFIHIRSVANICTPFFSVDALEGTWGTSCRMFCISLFFIHFLGNLLRKQDISKLKQQQGKISYWGEVEKSKSDSSYMKKHWLLKLSCSVTYHQLDYYLAQEDCNKLSDFLLSWNDGWKLCCVFLDRHGGGNPACSRFPHMPDLPWCTNPIS